MSANRAMWRGYLIGMVLVGLAGRGAALTREWTGGAGTPDWSAAANWTPADAPPQPGDEVVIAGGASVVLAADSAMLGSFAITNATLTFTNWNTTLRATNVFIRAGALLTLPAPFRAAAGEMTNNLTIVCTNLSLDAGGAIDVSGKGHNYSDGAGKGADGTYSGGGGHGGRGGNGFNTIQLTCRGGLPNDTLTAPVLPGSGGGSYQAANAANRGGAGGGAVCIEAAATCTINGSIRANGNVSGHASGGGAGGSVYIACGRLAGSTNGLVEAAGGAVKNAGGGGAGGRIAVMYRDLDGLPRIRFRAAAGKGTYWCDWDQHWLHAAEPGTLALPDARLLSPLLTGDQFRDVRLDIGASAWATPSLVVSNASLTFAHPGFALEVTNDLVIANGHLGVGFTNATGLTRIDVGGDLVLDSGGALYLYAGVTNGTPRDYGACLSVTGDVHIGADAWIYPYAHNRDGGTVLLRVSNLVVAAAGGINADAKGYDCDLGPGRAVGGVDYPCGGGYGGHGGDGKYSGVTTLKGGIAYGSVACPIGPGSGGGSYQPQKGNRGGAGGGAIRIVAAGEVALEGTLSACGENGDHASGGGSGGAINVACRTFGGTGRLCADGGGGRVKLADGSDNYSVTGVNGSGGGGGGRIAIAYDSLAPAAGPRFSTLPGNSRYQPTPGDPRTAWMGTIHLADDGLLGETLTGIHGNLVIPGVDSWSPASLTVSNAAVGFAEAFRLQPGGAVTVTGAGSMLVMQPGAELACGGDLVLTNGAALMAYSGPTNGAPGDCGARVQVSGTLHIATNCWVYPYARGTDDSAPLFNVGSLLVEPGGGFNANAAGYRESAGAGKGGGPGAYCAGAGHGGKGGRGSAPSYLEGDTYGSTNAPLTPGSGGGNYWSDARVGGRGGAGGGVIRIVAAREARVDGTLTAAGGVSEHVSGGGAGGSIFLACGSFAGGSSARLDVAGGEGRNWQNLSNPLSGGGGGGRIAVAAGFSDNDLETLIAGSPVERLAASPTHPDYEGSIGVTNGVGYYLPPHEYGATSGTWTFLRIAPPPGSVLLVR